MNPFDRTEFRQDLALAQAGDRAAASRVGEALAPRIETMMRVRLAGWQLSWDLIEDLKQDVQVAVSRGLARLPERDAEGALRAFLSTVVRNKVVDLMRRPRLRGAAPAPAGPPPAPVTDVLGSLQALQASNSSPSSHVHRTLLFQQVLQSMADLPERQREALTLAFIDELDSRAIGEVLGCTRQAAAMLVLRSLRALRERWDGEGAGV